MPAAPWLQLDPAREQQELSEYLGDEFQLERLQQYQATLAEEFSDCGDEERFYRESNGYLYNLTAFAMTGTKLPYLEQLTRAVPPGARLLDYGCGIGSDGLLLLEAGYRVEFADFDNPSTAYLRWRLERRGFDAPVHDLDMEVPGGFDGSYAFDVIEHVADAYAFVEEMERRSALVCVNLLEPEEDDQDIHHELPINGLLMRAAGRRLVSYRVLHGSSHLILYGPEPAGPLARVVNLGKLAAGRLARRRS